MNIVHVVEMDSWSLLYSEYMNGITPNPIPIDRLMLFQNIKLHSYFTSPLLKKWVGSLRYSNVSISVSVNKWRMGKPQAKRGSKYIEYSPLQQLMNSYMHLTELMLMWCYVELLLWLCHFGPEVRQILYLLHERRESPTKHTVPLDIVCTYS